MQGMLRAKCLSPLVSLEVKYPGLGNQEGFQEGNNSSGLQKCKYLRLEGTLMIIYSSSFLFFSFVFF